ncbi:MAG: HD domain-containing phosphohydrolase [Candidatus Coatesbacteria bacterium]
MNAPSYPDRRSRGGSGRTTGIESAGILIVDDQQGDLDILRDLLVQAGFLHVECERDSRRAAERYAAARPDLVILDLEMPELDGLAVLEQLRTLEPNGWLTVLALASRPDPDTRLRALDLGAKDIIAKPFHPPEALARIRNLLETRLLSRRVSEQNLLLEQSVLDRTQELRSAQLEIVHRLAAAAERRDHSAGPHLIRMSHFSACVAKAHGWSPDRVDLLRQASPLHDVGKIGIPDAILLKPGPLTEEEWKTMRTHTSIGAGMLSGGASQLIRTGAVIALSHHERWDGAGYPEGLAGESIPVSARICSVCDVFDAMSSFRCYHSPISLEEAAAFVVAGRGTRFDPQVVASFERALPEILEVRKATMSAEESAPA